MGSVVAKLQNNGAERGKAGAYAYLGAVYEGSAELQAISENAIFGNASPSGQLNLYGDLPIEQFGFSQDEFYVHLDEEPVTRPGVFMHFTLHKTYESAFNPNCPTNPITYRWAVGGPCRGDFYLGVVNPAATSLLSARDMWHGSIRMAIQKQSDEFIQLLEKKLAADMEMYSKCNTDSAVVKRYTLTLRRKLARAKGEQQPTE